MDVDTADQIVRLARRDPVEALDRARRLQSLPDPALAARGHWAEGRALLEFGRADEAARSFARATAQAEEDIRARIAVHHAHALWSAGQQGRARMLMGTVAGSSAPVVAANGRVGLAVFDLTSGRLEEAVDRFESALTVLRDEPDEQDTVADALLNLGYCLLFTERLDEAEQAFVGAETVARRIGARPAVAAALQNLGYLTVLRGDLPLALSRLDAAAAAYVEAVGTSDGAAASRLHDDVAEAHRLAGLLPEAVDAARRAVAAADEGDDLDWRAQARHMLARCLLDAGQHAEAADVASAARDVFARAGRVVWAERARLLAIEAAAEGSLAGRWFDEAPAVAAQLAAAGWLVEATRVRNRLADEHLRRGDADRASEVLRGVEVGGATAVARLEEALTAVLRCRAEGRAVGPALADALRVVHDRQRRLADAELRAGVGRSLGVLRRWAVASALDAGDAAGALRAVDDWRSLSRRLARAQPEDDAEVVAASTALRAAEARVRAAETVAPTDLAELGRREQALRRASLRAVPSGVPDVPTDPEEDVLAAATVRLAGRAMVSWTVHDGVLHGFVLVDGAVRHRAIGPVADVQTLAVRLRRELGRCLRPGQPAGVAAARFVGVTADAARLRVVLLPDGVPDGEVVVVPPTDLVALPWALVLGGSGRPVTVAASIGGWLDGGGDVVGDRLGVLVGPDLEHGLRDAAGVEGWGTTTVVGDADATVDGLTALVGQVDVLHVAAHGTFRADSPRFSSLQLADGSFHLYALDRLDAPPVVSLAACDAGRSVSLPGGELLGTAPAWVAAGARVVVAPTHPVPDEAAAVVARALLAALPGRTPQAALAVVRARFADASVEVATTSQVLTCYGGHAGVVGG